jgi:hypothetical protein
MTQVFDTTSAIFGGWRLLIDDYCSPAMPMLRAICYSIVLALSRA